MGFFIVDAEAYYEIGRHVSGEPWGTIRGTPDGNSVSAADYLRPHIETYEVEGEYRVLRRAFCTFDTTQFVSVTHVELQATLVGRDEVGGLGTAHNIVPYTGEIVSPSYSDYGLSNWGAELGGFNAPKSIGTVTLMTISPSSIALGGTTALGIRHTRDYLNLEPAWAYPQYARFTFTVRLAIEGEKATGGPTGILSKKGIPLSSIASIKGIPLASIAKLKGVGG